MAGYAKIVFVVFCSAPRRADAIHTGTDLRVVPIRGRLSPSRTTTRRADNRFCRILLYRHDARRTWAVHLTAPWPQPATLRVCRLVRKRFYRARTGRFARGVLGNLCRLMAGYAHRASTVLSYFAGEERRVRLMGLGQPANRGMAYVERSGNVGQHFSGITSCNGFLALVTCQFRFAAHHHPTGLGALTAFAGATAD
jgi:hypothetical protein